MLVITVWPTNNPSVKFFDLLANNAPTTETIINELKNNSIGIKPSSMYNKGRENNRLSIPPKIKHYYLVALRKYKLC